MNISISIKVIKYEHDFYEMTADILHLFPGRRCFGCGRKFRWHDMVSMAITDRGNKEFHADCLRAAMESN